MNCPICNHELKQIRRGASLKRRGPAYVCPVAESETVKDEHGHLSRISGALHRYVQVWESWTLEAAK